MLALLLIQAPSPRKNSHQGRYCLGGGGPFQMQITKPLRVIFYSARANRSLPLRSSSMNEALNQSSRRPVL